MSTLLVLLAYSCHPAPITEWQHLAIGARTIPLAVWSTVVRPHCARRSSQNIRNCRAACGSFAPMLQVRALQHWPGGDGSHHAPASTKTRDPQPHWCRRRRGRGVGFVSPHEPPRRPQSARGGCGDLPPRRRHRQTTGSNPRAPAPAQGSTSPILPDRTSGQRDSSGQPRTRREHGQMTPPRRQQVGASPIRSWRALGGRSFR